MRSSMKHCISKRFNPLANQKPILFIPFSFASPSLLSSNDKRGIKWTRRECGISKCGEGVGAGRSSVSDDYIGEIAL